MSSATDLIHSCNTIEKPSIIVVSADYAFHAKASNRVSRCPRARATSFLDWSPKATAIFLRICQVLLHNYAEMCEGRKKRKPLIACGSRVWNSERLFVIMGRALVLW